MMHDSKRYDKYYKYLKTHNRDIYDKILAYSSAIVINHGLTNNIGADIEISMVMLAYEILNGREDTN